MKSLKSHILSDGGFALALGGGGLLRKLKLLAVVGVALATGSVRAESTTWSEKQAFTATTTVADDVTLVGEIEVEVSGGATLTLSGAVSGEGSILKTGSGTLVLSHADNTFANSGRSIVVNAGTLQADASEAFGAGSVECSGGIVRLNADGATFANALTFSSYLEDTHQLVFAESATLSGAITVTQDTLKIDVGTETTHVGKKAMFAGAVSAADATLRLATVEDYEFKGAVTCGTLYLNDKNQWSGRQGKVTLDSPKNSIGLISLYGSGVVAAAEGALGGARCLIRTWMSGGGLQEINLNGYSQAVKALDLSSDITIDGTAARIMATSGSPVLTITGDETSAVTRGYFGDAGAQLKIDVDVEKYPNFVQTFSGSLNPDDKYYANRENKTTKPLVVTSGTLRLDNDVKFTSVPSVEIGEKGVLQIGATTNVLSGVTAITCAGRLEIADTASAPFAGGQVALALASTAKLTIPSGLTIRLKSLTVDGIAQTKGFYDSTSLSIEGGGELYTDGEAASVSDSTWTAGGGSDTSVGMAANWGGTLPGLSSFETRATFATAGTEATIDRAVRFEKLTFDAPGDFALRKSGNAQLAIGADGLAVAAGSDDAARAYVIEPSVSVYDVQTWTIPTNRTLTLANGLLNADGAFVTIYGTGGLVWRGTNTLAATVTLANAPLTVENGVIASVNHAWEGEVYGSTAIGAFMEVKTNGIVLANGRIEKSMRIDPVVRGESIVTARAGTTNEVSGYIRQNDTQTPTGFTVEDGAELTLSGGYHSWRETYKYGLGTLRIRSREFGSKGRTYGFLVKDGRVVFEDGAKLVTAGLWLALGEEDGSTASVEFLSDGAFGTCDAANYPVVDSRLALGTYVGWYSGDQVLRDRASGVGTATFHSTTQEVRQVVCGSLGVLTGEAGSLLRVVGDQDSTDGLGVVYGCTAGIRGEVNGALSIEMGGTGTLVLSGRDFASTGELAVTNGTLKLASDASWANGNVRIEGNGRLLLDGRRQLSRQAAVRFGDSGKLEISDGRQVAVGSLSVRDAETGAWQALPAGVYTAESTGAMSGRIVSGSVRVGELGMIFIVR